MRRAGQSVEKISDLGGLSQTNPPLAYAMAILMFSMSGIPPLAGFFSKLMVFQAAVAGGFYILAVVGVVSSVVAAYYYLKIIKVMFFDEKMPNFDLVPVARKIVLVVSIAFVVSFIFWPAPLIQQTQAAAASLFPGG
jgi:NADH-quinone oxidoreductase subunit N